MDQELVPPKLEWPQWQWKPGLLVDFVSFVLGFALFFHPDLSAKQIRFFIGIPLMSIPISFPTLVWLGKISCVVWQRMRCYPKLYHHAQQYANELTHAKRTTYAIAQNTLAAHVFEIAGTRYDRGKLYIMLNKRRGRKLVQDDTLLVVHNDDGMSMGIFQVTEVRTDGYYAVGVNSVDPLWLGHIREQGEVHIQPHLIAFHMPEGEE